MSRRRDRLQLFSVAALLVLFAGCSGTTVPQSTKGAQRETGGGFVAQYDGGFTSVQCSLGTSGRFTFGGAGRAEYARTSTEIGKLTAHPTAGICQWNGEGRFASKRHPADSIVVTLSLDDGIGFGPCTDGVNYVVKRGTGRFARASGSGTLLFVCTGAGHGTQIDSWSGTLTFRVNSPRQSTERRTS
ncbi:MAG TPA: hypothetical protein VFE16_06835 [Candidatus Cybelea sp.]|jgi:hypothetical protein|nr:hypothetical protein [Candidatus Cybelea sp.]